MIVAAANTHLAGMRGGGMLPMTDPKALRIRWLTDLRLGDRATVGGKGANLGELTQAGVEVPSGFVLTTAAFETSLATLDRTAAIRTRIQALAGADRLTIEATCSAIRREIEDAPLDHDLHREIADAYRRVAADCCNRPVAVRSSATVEDHAVASFAGLQDTLLWVVGIDAVTAAVKQCWSSLYSVESVTYRLRLNLPEGEVRMAVVVQDMVEARVAGVMFTRSPTTGDRSVVVLEAAWGLCSAVVGGEVTPDRFVVSKVTGEISKRAISRKTIQHLPNIRNRRVETCNVPESLQMVSCLSDGEIHALVAAAKRIERHCGHPQDIEWAIDRQAGETSRILMLQSRPETVWSNRSRPGPVEPESRPVARVLRALVDRGCRP
jgi:pyruvate,water dikinase